MCLFVKNTRVYYFTSSSSPLLEVITMSQKETKTHPVLNLDTVEFHDDLDDRD